MNDSCDHLAYHLSPGSYGREQGRLAALPTGAVLLNIRIVRAGQFCRRLPGYALCLRLAEETELRAGSEFGEIPVSQRAEDEIRLLLPDREFPLGSSRVAGASWIEIGFSTLWIDRIAGGDREAYCQSLEALAQGSIRDIELKLLMLQLYSLKNRSLRQRNMPADGAMISILGRLVVLAADDQAQLPEDCSDEVPPSTLQAALDYMQTHIDSKLTLDRVACAVGRSRSHLAKLFRQKTGGTFIDCLNQLRIQRAKELIGFYGRPRSFAEVARQCGFANHAHLTRTFVQYVGKTPRAYRLGQ